MQIEGYTDDPTLNTMIAGLKPSKFLWWIGKYDLTNFQELLNQAKKYVNIEQLMVA